MSLVRGSKKKDYDGEKGAELAEIALKLFEEETKKRLYGR